MTPLMPKLTPEEEKNVACPKRQQRQRKTLDKCFEFSIDMH